ncbi:MAG: DNA-3-methyladenine glycosylase [candidate division Zixibacteria bacterium]|nr:DNA-3-methyladenine glycosylase [candidate division Zixibacteria bacterium]
MAPQALILPQSFYNRNTLAVAEELLGKVFRRTISSSTLSGRIVETEAYIAKNDPACHAFNGRTDRNEIMFGPPGFAYVYFTYGMHYCLNFVTEPEGVAAAVLIRALEPISGIETMKANRKTDKITNLCSGPAKLTQALSITKEDNGLPLFEGNFLVEDDGFLDFDIVTTTRIGIRQGAEFPWRFYIKDSPYVSRK